MGTWNEKEKVLVQYFEKCTFEKRNLVKRKMLIPFYGGQENEIRTPCVDKRNRSSNLGTIISEDEIKELHKNMPSESKLQWCDQHLDLLTKQLKRSRTKSHLITQPQKSISRYVGQNQRFSDLVILLHITTQPPLLVTKEGIVKQRSCR